MARIHNYYAGPAALPVEVLEEAQKELIEWAGTGMSVMETSHRSKEYDDVHNGAIALFKELLGLDDDWHIMLLQGGASQQFAVVPWNFLGKGKSADYILTGSWSKKAIKEAKIFGDAKIAGNTEADGVFRRVPKQDELTLDPNAVYVHLTSNNTIFGTQWHGFPDTGAVPLVADMSSDILSWKFDPKPFGLIYAGAQKNLGPSGVTLVAIQDDLYKKCNDGLPTMFTYRTHVEKNSLFNTPPSFGIYLLGLVLKWIKGKGGVEGMEKINREKSGILYGAIENSGGFYSCPVERESRSFMNIVFRLPTEDLEKKFIAEGKDAGFIGMKGHRSVGGCRISAYNANGVKSVKDIVAFMDDFKAKNG
ncbi:MAG: 3-phosphoserine/phosphohydroxythreonine transaminase [Planctomycetota bacterium]|jgi:phosphoserine aminotransferase